MQLNASAQIPAVDGSLLTNSATRTKLQTKNISATAPTANQVLEYNALSSQWEAMANTSSQWTTNGTSIFYNTGNVGIGTTSPANKLDVNGGINTSGFSTFSNTSAGITAPVTINNAFSTPTANFGVSLAFDNGSVQTSNITSAWNGSASTDAYLSFSTLGSSSVTEKMRITSGGNVGIGTTSPGYKLDVAGSVNASAVLVNGVPVGTGSGSVSNISAGTGLTGGNITTAGTLNVDVGTTANKILQLNASAQIPAVDGSLLTNVSASANKIIGKNIGAVAPTANQVLDTMP